MVEAVLKLFTSEQKVTAMLANPVIEFIFMVLFVTFIIALIIHITLYQRLKNLRNHIKTTNRLDVEPLHTMQDQFQKKQEKESVKVETFIQEKFSDWRMYHIPVISLIKIIQMTVSIFILIGVLGTFIGLTFSLGSIDGTGDQLVENVAGVLGGIDVAFYTSIVGMGLSLIMTILVKVLNTEYMLTDIMLKTESILEGEEQQGLNRLIDVSEDINQSIIHLQKTNQQSLQNMEAAFSGFQEYTTGLQQSAKDLASFNEGLSQNLEEFNHLFHSMKEVTNGFNEGTSKLNKNFDSLFSHFKKMDGRNERMTIAFEQTYEKVKQVAETQLETLTQFDASVVDLKDFTASMLQGQETIKHIFEKIYQHSNDLVKKMETQNKEFKQVFGSDLTSKLGGIMSYLSELSREFDQLGASITKLPHALEVIERTQNEHRHLLSDRFEELKEFNRVFSNHLHAHTKESSAFEKQLQQATTSYEQVGIKNNQLIQEIKSTISQMNQGFQQRENQLESSVSILKDTLANYVANLEGSLGDRLDQVARGFGEYMRGTNDVVKREMKEWQRISEDTQQNNMRAFQRMMEELGREIHTLNQQLNTFDQQARRQINSIGMSRNEY
ncbi:MotA/TolQ/ExbB proton channel family protein [Virgibacillus halodenitrificans]|uniref:MotA/TolQ/ExbB proton channel family protein n=1 Tax=Virgibacillus halodenitrificans TaxID=1482 RepID=UPI00045CE942|nr:MotA/TolQ/ExbB proton channel family protein [Virgibacillus halodenitrificans]CDQ35325.1 chromosome segregation protein SMC [Virgibacillus halodenitrificans]